MYYITTYSYDTESETTETCKAWLLLKKKLIIFLAWLYNNQKYFIYMYVW